MSRILCVVAHPDDETIGVGGTLARHISEGDEVAVLTFTDGVGARNEVKAQTEADRREREHWEVCATLGIGRSFYLKAFDDQRMDAEPVATVARPIEKIIREFRPDVIYTHFPGDLNADHRKVAEAVLVATRPMAGSSVRRVLACEIPESTSQVFGPWPGFKPNVYVEIGGVCLDAKIAALECYKSEKREPPHPRSSDMVIAHARARGSEVGMVAAEAFVLLREVV